MSVLALLADASTTPGVDPTPPWWLSGAWGLLGTVIGGFITFITTRAIASKNQKAEQERNRKEQLTDIATRYIRAVSKKVVDSVKVEETIAEYQQLLADAQSCTDPHGQAEALKSSLRQRSTIPTL